MQITDAVLGGLSIGAAALSIWTANNSGLRRLAIIQRRLDASLGLITSLRTRVKDLEGFAAAKHNYHVRSGDSEIEEFFSNSYNDCDTGF